MNPCPQHMQRAHAPKVRCSCGELYGTGEGDRAAHLRASLAHPSCVICGDGFLDASALDKVSRDVLLAYAWPGSILY